MLPYTYLAVLASVMMLTSALPMPPNPKLGLNTNVKATGPPTPNNDWPKTITDGQQRQRRPSESPTLLPGSPIGGHQNDKPGQHKTHNSPASPGKNHRRDPEAEAGRPKLGLNTNVQATGPPTPNNGWPKTITEGEQR